MKGMPSGRSQVLALASPPHTPLPSSFGGWLDPAPGGRAYLLQIASKSCGLNLGWFVQTLVGSKLYLYCLEHIWLLQMGFKELTS